MTAPGVVKRGKASFSCLMRSSVTSTPIGLSIAVPQTIPAPCAGWVSPMERARDHHRQVERGARGEVADVEVAAHAPGWDDGVVPRLRWCRADGVGEELERHPRDVREERGREGARVAVPDLQVRVGELIGQQPEAPDVRRPAEARGVERLQRDLQHVPRLGPVDEDGPGDRIDQPEVEVRDVRRGALPRELPARAVEAAHVQPVAGRHRLGTRIDLSQP